MFPNFENILQFHDPLDIQHFCENNFKNQPVHLYWKDENGKYLGCNGLQASNAGFGSVDDMIGHTDLDLGWTTEVCANRFSKTNKEIMLSGKSQMLFETALIRGTTPLTTFSYKVPLYNQNKKICGISGISIIFTPQNLITQSSLSLTAKQEDCLYFLVRGMTIKEIAKQLTLSPKTVEHYIENIKTKLGCYSRSDLISYALKMTSIQMRLFFNS